MPDISANPEDCAREVIEWLVRNHGFQSTSLESDMTHLASLIRRTTNARKTKAIQEVLGISEGRRLTLIEKSDECRREWIRAERAEAAHAELRAALMLMHLQVKAALSKLTTSEWAEAEKSARATLARAQEEPAPTAIEIAEASERKGAPGT